MLTHVTAADAGEIAVILACWGHRVETRRLNKDAVLPKNIKDYAGIVSFGGPASANDEHVVLVRLEFGHQKILRSVQTPIAHRRTYMSVNPTQKRLSHAHIMCLRLRQETHR